VPAGANNAKTYDVSKDDKRIFLVKKAAGDQAAPPQILIRQNWLEDLKRLAPAKK